MRNRLGTRTDQAARTCSPSDRASLWDRCLNRAHRDDEQLLPPEAQRERAPHGGAGAPARRARSRRARHHRRPSRGATGGVAGRLSGRPDAELDSAAVPHRDELRDPVDHQAAQRPGAVPTPRRVPARRRPPGWPVLRSHLRDRGLGPAAQGPDRLDRVHRARAQRPDRPQDPVARRPAVGAPLHLHRSPDDRRHRHADRLVRPAPLPRTRRPHRHRHDRRRARPVCRRRRAQGAGPARAGRPPGGALTRSRHPA